MIPVKRIDSWVAYLHLNFVSSRDSPVGWMVTAELEPAGRFPESSATTSTNTVVRLRGCEKVFELAAIRAHTSKVEGSAVGSLLLAESGIDWPKAGMKE